MEYTIGNTYQLQAKFYDRSDGVTLVDMDSVTFKVYDHDRNQIGDTINVGSEYKQGVGHYLINYTIPNNPPYIDIEWAGTTTEYSDVSRDRLYITWAENDINVLPTPTLTVETNTYISLADANTYFDLRLASEAWYESSDIDRAKALIQATKNIDKLLLKGAKQNTEQALQFPRFLNSEKAGLLALFTSGQNSDIPTLVEEATCEEAIALLKNQIEPNQRLELQRQGVKSIKFGHASETYITRPSGIVLTSNVALDLMKPYIANTIKIDRGR